MSTVHVSAGWLTSTVITVAFVLLYPIVLAIIAHRRLKVGWRYFGFGALIFFLFQMISRVPLVAVLGNVLAPQLKASSLFAFIWLVILCITAGLFEEIGRYVGYRWLMKNEEKTWNKAVMYGIGHGGLESMLFVGGLALLTLINTIALTTMNLDVLPANQRATVVQQFAAINAQPAWFPLLGAWERLWTIPVQVALSVVVLQVFRRGSMRWLWLAILAHAIVDFSSVELLRILGPGTNSSLIVEGVVACFGLVSIWVIWQLRDRPVSAVTTVEQSTEAVSPDAPVA